MRLATCLMFSCSQTRKTTHPDLIKQRVILRSRVRFAFNFFNHQSRLAFGIVLCWGHRCQKQPSTKTATFERGNAISMAPRKPGSLWWRRKRSFLACNSERSDISIAVSRCLLARIRAFACKDEGAGVRNSPSIWLERIRQIFSVFLNRSPILRRNIAPFQLGEEVATGHGRFPGKTLARSSWKRGSSRKGSSRGSVFIPVRSKPSRF